MTKALLPILPLFLICSLVNVNEGVHSFGQKKVLELHRFQWNHVLKCHSPKSRRENGVTVLEIKHKDCSSAGGPVNWNKKLQNRLVIDDQRARSFQYRIQKMISENNNNNNNNNNSIEYGVLVSSVKTRRRPNNNIPLTSGIEFDSLNYIVSVSLGDQNLSLIVDTGSDLTWVQCKPCKMCYNQKGPLFNPSISSSYQAVLCSSLICQDVQGGQCDTIKATTEPCGYVVNYGDGSYTRGEIGRERLNLGSSRTRSTDVDDFVFGCGRDNKGLFGRASGLLGLGRGSVSLVSQSASLFGGVFSYCLPSTDQTSGSLILGSGIGNSSKKSSAAAADISYTKMVLNPQLPAFYFLNLTGISVGGVALKSPSFGNGMMTIDSGTVITRLPPTMYKAVKAEYRKQFSEYPTASTYLILDTCYNLTGYQGVDVPLIKLEFEGNAEMSVDVSGILYFVKTDASQVCLALSSLSNEDETGIIGNYQQKNHRVIYNTNNSKLGFLPEKCS